MRLALLLWAAALAAQVREIPFDANVLRADRKADLIAGDHRVELRRGTVVFFINDSGAPPVEIVTPNVSVHPYFAGSYKVEVKGSGETVVTPEGGDVKVAAVQGIEWVPVGWKMIVRGPAAAPRYRIVSAASGWKWIGQALAAMAQNSGSSVSVDSGSSSDNSSPPSRPSSPPPSSVGGGASSGETRSGSSPSRGK